VKEPSHRNEVDGSADYTETLYRRHLQGALVRSGASAIMWLFALAAVLTNVIKMNQFIGITLSVVYLILINPPTLLLLKHINQMHLYRYTSLLINFLEILGYTAIIYFLGGIEATFVTPIYAAVIVYVGVVSPRRFPFVISIMCSAAFSFVVAGEYFGLLPHQSVALSFHTPLLTQLANLSVVIGLLFVVAYISSLTGAILKKSRNKLREKNLELMEKTASLKEADRGLRRAHQELESRVEKRTAELREANDRLNAEIRGRKRAEEALRQSEERYRTLVETSPDAIVLMDLNLNLIMVNRQALTLYGYENPEEVVGKNGFDFIAPEDRPRAVEDVRKMLETGSIGTPEYSLLRKDGIPFPAEVRASMIVNAEKKPLAFILVTTDIANRKRAEEALRKSEERYRTLFEESRDAIYITSGEGEILDANHFMSDLFGYSREEMLGLNSRKTYAYPEDRIKFQREIERNGFVRDYEIKLRKKDGTEMDCLLTANARHADDGSILGYQGIIRDITELKLIENELHTEKQRFQTLSENAPFGMVMIDQDGTFRYMNPKFRELFGYDLNDVPDGRTWFRKLYPDPTYRHNVISTWVNDLDSSNPGEKRPRIFAMTCKDGTEKIINFIPVQLETGENLMACEDITERKRAEEALHQSEEKYRTILESIEDGYYEVDLAGNLTFFNDSMCRIWGYSKEELMGMNNRQYTDQENAKRVYQAFNRVYRTGEPVRGFDWEIIRKDGTKRYIETSVSLRKDASGKPIGFRGIGRDITDRKRIEEQLFQSEKLRAVGEMASGVAHDFNNALAAILGNTQLLLYTAQDEELKEPLRIIEQVAKDSSKTVRRLQDFTRRRVPQELFKVDINAIIKDSIEMTKPKWKDEAQSRGISIEMVSNLDNIPLVSGNASELREVITNMIFNAIEAIHEGGKIEIVRLRNEGMSMSRFQIQELGSQKR